MILSITNPPMDRTEISEFRKKFIQYASGKISVDEKKQIKKRYEQMCSTSAKIIRNNGGKNPILGY